MKARKENFRKFSQYGVFDPQDVRNILCDVNETQPDEAVARPITLDDLKDSFTNIKINKRIIYMPIVKDNHIRGIIIDFNRGALIAFDPKPALTPCINERTQREFESVQKYLKLHDKVFKTNYAQQKMTLQTPKITQQEPTDNDNCGIYTILAFKQYTENGLTIEEEKFNPYDARCQYAELLLIQADDCKDKCVFCYLDCPQSKRRCTKCTRPIHCQNHNPIKGNPKRCELCKVFFATSV